MNYKLLFLGLLLLLFTSQAFADTTPPVTTFESFQVPNTTDQNITLVCIDGGTVCKAINYNVDNNIWINIQSTTLKNGLEAYYNFNETSGNLIDLVGYDNNGVNTGVSYSQTGLINNDYNYQGRTAGSDTNIIITNLDKTKFTISMWIKGNNLTQNPTFFHWGNTTANNIGCWNWDNASTNYLTCYANSNSSSGLTTGKNILDGNWHNLIFDWNGTGFSIYIDNNYRGSKTAGATISGGDLKFGEFQTPLNTQFLGMLDETAIWNRSLTNTERTSLYNLGIGKTYPFGTDNNSISFLYSGIGDHNIQYFSTDSSDNNETIKTSTFTTYGNAGFNFIDENTYAPVTTTYTINPSINGVSNGSATSLDLNLTGITNQLYGFQFSATGYGTRFYYTDLNEFSAFDYNQLMLQDANAANNITLKIYNATGTTLQAGTAVTITKNNYLVGKYLTNTDGEITPFLNDLDTNYLFYVEGLYTTSQRPVLVYRPKFDSNFGDITGNWQITLTGPNSTNRYTITTNSQVIAILPNTETLYSAKICMLSGSVCNTSYFSRTYLLGFKGLVGETSIQPYLNLISDSTLRTLKVLDYATNQPYPLAKIVITSKTDLGATYIVESLYTDSTGTAGVYLTNGQTYTLTANDLTTYTIVPNAETLTYYIYFNFLVLPTDTPTGIDVNTYNDFNGAEFFVMRNTLFSCSGTSDCFPSALVAIVLTMIMLVVVTAATMNNFIGVKGLSLIAFLCFTIFFGIGWLPIYIFAFLGSITLLLLVVVQ